MMASDANSVQPSSPLPPSESDLSNTSEIKEENPTQQQSEDTNSNTTGLRRSSRVRKQTSHMVVVAKFSCFFIL